MLRSTMTSMRSIRMLLILLVALSFIAPLSPSHSQQRQDAEQKINALIARMTLEEKLGQLQQLDGEGNGNFRPEHRELARKGLLGSTLNVRGAPRTNELQRIAVEESRLKIPLLFGFDVIHGYRTIFPVPLAEASSWDPAVAETSASVAAAEARSAGVHWTFAPMMDIARDARWGRIVEGSGEDPYLGASFARARVRGFQGRDYSLPDKVLACAKHWVAYGAAEAGRDYNTTDMSEGTLRQVYFPPFKAAVDEGVGTFMSAANVSAAREVAARSIVLLKDERETLPLNKNVKSIAVIGPLADDRQNVLGSWTADGNVADAVTLLAGIKAKVSPETRINYAKGCDIS